MSYTDINKVKAQLGGQEITYTSVPSIGDVTEWISEASGEVDSRTGLSFGSEAFSDEIYDWEGNDDILRLPFEIVTISSLYYNAESAGETPVWVLKTVDEDFFVYGDSCEVEFNLRKFKPLAGKNRFKLSGTKGKSTVPPIVQRITTLLVANRFVESVIQQQAFANSGGDVQVGTIKVGNPSSFSVSAVKNNSMEIERLFDKVVGSFKAFRITRAYDL
jgi:hypothetical protein